MVRFNTFVDRFSPIQVLKICNGSVPNQFGFDPLKLNLTKPNCCWFLFMNHLISLQETINKQNEEIGPLMHENTKPQFIVIENESLKKTFAKLEDEIREQKQV